LGLFSSTRKFEFFLFFVSSHRSNNLGLGWGSVHFLFVSHASSCSEFFFPPSFLLLRVFEASWSRFFSHGHAVFLATKETCWPKSLCILPPLFRGQQAWCSIKRLVHQYVGLRHPFFPFSPLLSSALTSVAFGFRRFFRPSASNEGIQSSLPQDIPGSRSCICPKASLPLVPDSP